MCFGYLWSQGTGYLWCAGMTGSLSLAADKTIMRTIWRTTSRTSLNKFEQPVWTTTISRWLFSLAGIRRNIFSCNTSKNCHMFRIAWITFVLSYLVFQMIQIRRIITRDNNHITRYHSLSCFTIGLTLLITVLCNMFRQPTWKLQTTTTSSWLALIYHTK